MDKHPKDPMVTLSFTVDSLTAESLIGLYELLASPFGGPLRGHFIENQLPGLLEYWLSCITEAVLDEVGKLDHGGWTEREQRFMAEHFGSETPDEYVERLKTEKSKMLR